MKHRVAYHYFVSIFTFLFENTEFWIRFPSVLFGMGTILLVYHYTKKIDKIVAIFVLIFLIFSSYNIEYSRFARFYMMNTFLYVFSIIVFYRGFFENKKKYKLLSTLIFILMMHTVQAGAIFLSLIGGWCIYFLKNSFDEKEGHARVLKRKISDILFMVVFMIIYHVDNIFYRLFKIDMKYDSAFELGLTPEPITRSFISIPQWKLFSFFDENYIPLIFIIISITVIIFLYGKKEAEKFCGECHNPDGAAPLPDGHPPKYRCLFCHKKDL